MKKRLRCLLTSVIALFSLSGCGGAKSAASKGYAKWKQYQYDYLVKLGGKKSDVKFNSCEYVYVEDSGTEVAGSLKDSCFYDVIFTLFPNESNAFRDECYFAYYPNTDSIQSGATSQI